MEVEHEGRRYRGRAVNTDIVDASALAFLDVVNRIAAGRLPRRSPRASGDDLWSSLRRSPGRCSRRSGTTHLVRPETPETPAVLYVDLHLVHEVTSPQAFTVLRERGLRVRRPDRTVATMDHSTPTTPPGLAGEVRDHRSAVPEPAGGARAELPRVRHRAAPPGRGPPGHRSRHRARARAHPARDARVVCGDSHTSTHGAFGALAFGIGTSEVGHVLATQCLLQRRPRTLEVRVNGQLGPGVTAKDLILAIIAQLGVGGGTGHVHRVLGRGDPRRSRWRRG